MESLTSFDDLPSDTVVAIFAKLPAKSLIRASAVSRTWFSLITSPGLVNLQVRTYLSQHHDNSVLVVPNYLPHRDAAVLLSAVTGMIENTFVVPFNTASNTLKLAESIDGLLLLTECNVRDDFRDLYLWNPFLRKVRRIELVDSHFEEVISNTERRYLNLGFGFHNGELGERDYRIVRVVYVADDQDNMLGEVGPFAEIYSVSDRTWTVIENPAVPFIAYGNGVHVEGVYYWVAERKPNVAEDLRILCFDFNLEVFGVIRFPHDVNLCPGSGIEASYSLVNFHGSLGILAHWVDESAEVTTYPLWIWVMTANDGWNQPLKYSFDHICWPLKVTEGGFLVVETNQDGETYEFTTLVAYSLDNLQWRELGYGKSGPPNDQAEDTLHLTVPSTIDTSYVETCIMFTG